MNNQDHQTELLSEAVSLLRELVVWTRVTSFPTVKKILESELDTEQKRLVYQLTDGNTGTAEIQDITGINVRYVSEWWRQWEKLGLVEQSRVSKVKGRRQRVFDLSIFGIAVPEIQPEKGTEPE